MAHVSRTIAAAILAFTVLAGGAPARAEPPFAHLEKALPTGWSLLATGAELVIRHDRPCYVTGRHDGSATTASLVTIELRYHLEPRWSDGQLAAGRATNKQVADELRALAARHRINAIAQRKGQPHPTTADERARLAAYDAERAPLTARLVKLPRCSVADVSVFDGDDTYAQLSLELEPPDVIPQALHIVELMKQHCG